MGQSLWKHQLGCRVGVGGREAGESALSNFLFFPRPGRMGGVSHSEDAHGDGNDQVSERASFSPGRGCTE